MAKLQAEPDTGGALRRSGHGSGKPVTKIIEEYSDVYAFLAHYTGLGEAK